MAKWSFLTTQRTKTWKESDHKRIYSLQLQKMGKNKNCVLAGGTAVLHICDVPYGSSGFHMVPPGSAWFHTILHSSAWFHTVPHSSAWSRTIPIMWIHNACVCLGLLCVIRFPSKTPCCSDALVTLCYQWPIKVYELHRISHRSSSLFLLLSWKDSEWDQP